MKKSIQEDSVVQTLALCVFGGWAPLVVVSKIGRSINDGGSGGGAFPAFLPPCVPFTAPVVHGIYLSAFSCQLRPLVTFLHIMTAF